MGAVDPCAEIGLDGSVEVGAFERRVLHAPVRLDLLRPGMPRKSSADEDEALHELRMRNRKLERDAATTRDPHDRCAPLETVHLQGPRRGARAWA